MARQSRARVAGSKIMSYGTLYMNGMKQVVSETQQGKAIEQGVAVVDPGAGLDHCTTSKAGGKKARNNH